MAARRAWWVSFAIFSATLLCWTFTTALMGAPDEPAHTIKAVAIARGEFDTDIDRRVTAAGIRFPWTRLEVPGAYAQLDRLKACWVNQPSVPAACAPPVGDEENVRSTNTYVGSYPPLYYVLAGWPSRVFEARTALYAMRAVGALVCAALLASALASLTHAGRSRIIVLGFAFSVTPMVVFMAGSINPNGVEIAAAICAWASMLALVTDPRPPPTRLVARTAIAAVLLAATRTLSPAFVVFILAATLFIAGPRPALARLWNDTRVRWAAIATAVVTAGSASFVVVNRSYDAFIAWPVEEHRTRFEAARDALSLTGPRIEQSIGTLGWIGPGETHLPRALIDGWLFSVTALVALGLLLGSSRQRVVLAATALAAVMLPVAAQTFSADEYSVGWQGRYGLPLSVGVPILSAWIMDQSVRVPRAVERAAVVTVAFGVALAYVVAHARLMTRYVAGLPNGLFDSLHGGDWDGPFTPSILFGWAVVSSALWAVRLTVVSPRPTEPSGAEAPDHAPD